MDKVRRILSGGWLSSAISVFTRGFFSGSSKDSVDFSSTADILGVSLDGKAKAKNIVAMATSIALNGKISIPASNAGITSPSLMATLEAR